MKIDITIDISEGAFELATTYKRSEWPFLEDPPSLIIYGDRHGLLAADATSHLVEPVDIVGMENMAPSFPTGETYIQEVNAVEVRVPEEATIRTVHLVRCATEKPDLYYLDAIEAGQKWIFGVIDQNNGSMDVKEMSRSELCQILSKDKDERFHCLVKGGNR